MQLEDDLKNLDVESWISKLDTTGRATVQEIAKAVKTLENIDSILGPHTTRLDPTIVIETGTYFRAAAKLNSETNIQEMWLNIARQRIMLADIYILRFKQNWRSYAAAIAKEHYEKCIVPHDPRPCKCNTHENRLNHASWLTKLVLDIGNKLHNRCAIPWTISSIDHLVDLSPPRAFVWKSQIPVFSDPIAYANLASNIVENALCDWLGLPNNSRWTAKAMLPEIILGKLGMGALLLPSVWSIYSTDARLFVNHESSLRSGCTVSKRSFTRFTMLLDVKTSNAGEQSARNKLTALQSEYQTLISGKPKPNMSDGKRPKRKRKAQEALDNDAEINTQDVIQKSNKKRKTKKNVDK